MSTFPVEPIPLYTIKDGPGEIAANGLLARYEKGKGKGKAIFFQNAPWKMNTKKETFLRYSRWRTCHTIALIVANLGVPLKADEKLALLGAAEYAPLNLHGEWDVAIARPMQPVTGDDAPHTDSVNDAEDQRFLTAKKNTLPWRKVQLTAPLEETEDMFDGAVWFRKTIELSSKDAGQDCVLSLGSIDDFDTTYVNGQKIGDTGIEKPEYWKFQRKYSVPAHILKEGKNVIAVRVFDHFGTGGFSGKPGNMKLLRKDKSTVASLAGPWQMKVETRLPPAKQGKFHKDNGIADYAKTWMEAELDDTKWHTVSVPVDIEKTTFNYDGVFWLSRTIDIPETWKNEQMEMIFGPTDDALKLYVNNIFAAESTLKNDTATIRTMSIPKGMLKPGENRISLRVFDARGPAGLAGDKHRMLLQIKGHCAGYPIYHTDYRSDFAAGDDPYRYYRW